jgi:hypothetical protein
MKGVAEEQTMRNGQNKRMRGRNRKGGHHHHHQNPLSRMYESNGPDVKIRGTASHIAEKYLQLARDAQSSGDPVAAENYYQHAEHYFRLIAAAQEQLRQNQPYFQQQPSGGMGGNNPAEEAYDDDDQPQVGEPYAPQAQPFYPREQQHHQNNQHQPQQHPQHQPQQPQHYQQRSPQAPGNEEDVERLPSFITGGQPQAQQGPQQGQSPHQGGNGQNGQNGYDGAPDRYPLHRRRRRHRGGGPRDYADQSVAGDNEGQPASDPHSNDE